ncbi:superfamily II DNA/RNA helicase [Branchiibius hedensis]|uniref:Superfamily II DNA and RNA helicase n=1 Tax=Branchiibius hedensis TaxID=672460 RepID=A0A2Y8ZTH7_9MICO|nr:DEAD/DEAH box helicase [Branchiibius hedensis]PWJ26890.1 superfamily II DNA/RNA helicase [Branchiibius hedensis]SSA35701.1 Superfamily II DNA and RNA helicase [Branchiibius hedensis]
MSLSTSARPAAQKATTSFGALGVPAPLVEVLTTAGITQPTPIQTATLPDSLAGRDVLGRGRTGSGKTYAFLLPLVARLAASSGRRTPKRPRALILAPTRELATQIDEALAPLAAKYRLTSRTVFGGVGQGPQVSAIRSGVDVVVACPGRLEDLMGQGHVDLSAVEITVLDEADHMADLGFLPGVRRILAKTPQRSQRLLFSATLDSGVNQLVKAFLHQPVTHEADSAQSPVSAMSHHVLHVADKDHLPVLTDLVAAPGRTVVFTRTKHRAKKLARQLNSIGVPAVELHGNLSQGARTRSMDAFHSGAAQTLVATDIAARGIHVDDVALVIHADPPVEHKAYLHRSGRTARAGAQGTVITLMTDDQVRDVRDLTRQAGIKPTTTRVTAEHPLLRELVPGERTFAEPSAVSPAAAPAQASAGGNRASGSGNRSGGGRSGGRGRSHRSSAQSGRSASGQSGRSASGQSGRSSSGRTASSSGSGRSAQPATRRSGAADFSARRSSRAR